jgi:hypothetical protein
MAIIDPRGNDERRTDDNLENDSDHRCGRHNWGRGDYGSRGNGHDRSGDNDWDGAYDNDRVMVVGMVNSTGLGGACGQSNVF